MFRSLAPLMLLFSCIVVKSQDVDPIENLTLGKLVTVLDKDRRVQSTCIPISCKYIEGRFRIGFISAKHATRIGKYHVVYIYNIRAPQMPLAELSIDEVKNHPLYDISYITALSDIPISIRPLSRPTQFSKVVSAGFPFGLKMMFFTGYVMRHDRDNLWFSNCPIFPGMSGGPIIDANTGATIGVIVSALRVTQNTNYGVLITDIPNIQRFESVELIKSWAKEL